MFGKLLHRMFGNSAAVTREFFRDQAEMEDLLRRERMRADRSGGSFSLVRFSVVAGAAREELLEELEWALAQQLRATDYAGLLQDGRLGVILPDTPAEGAWKVADNVGTVLPVDVVSPDFEVYEYPLRDVPADLKVYDESDADDDAPRAPVRAVESLFVQPLPGWKRALDVMGAAFGLVLLSPLLAAVAVAIKLFMPGPVLFWQKRTGLGGQPFFICKFRSMVVDAEARQQALRAQNEQDGPAFKIKHDPRVTRLGRLLRATSIDELPQLWNVLRGDMTLVGPRPLPCHEAEGCQPWQRRRLEVTPGLTCIWQVEGRSRVTFDEWVRMDLKYASRRSLATDLKLLAQTVPAVIAKKGAC